ncbi:N-acetylmuramoyl-L-alanine amidase [bacterium]|nr:N-acetylmuramoyl-L-alanine amidase [bacterium]
MTLWRILACSLFMTVLAMQPGAAQAGGYHMLLGTRLQSFDHPPMLEADGRTYVSLSVLQKLGLDRNASLRAADAPEGQEEQAALSSEPGQRFQLAEHQLELLPGDASRVLINGKPSAAGEVLSDGRELYLAASTFARLGLRLAYDPDQELPQLVGRVYRVKFEEGEESLTLASLTPMSLREELSPEKVKARNSAPEDARALKEGQAPAGRQPASGQPELTTLIVDGAYFGSTDSMDLAGELVNRVGFKNVEGSGRSYLYLRQPRRTGFSLAADRLVGFARIRLGNFFQLASYRQTSSGEISVNVQLGAPAEHKVQVMSNPDRLVMDFEDVRFEEASQNIAVGVGHVESIRVGAPEAGRVRVVLDLSQRLDYRVLSKDNGARLFVQLLPPSDLPGLKPKQQRSSRAIMLDAGHGGSDPGALGAVPGTGEAKNNLAICKLLEAELKAMGYTVMQTRSDDRFVSLGQRGDYANYTLPYVFVSIHCNAMDGRPDFEGAMTFHHTYAGPEARALAKSVQAAMIESTGAVDKGVREADFFVLRETVMPAILVETGFMSNKAECALLASDAYRRKLAHGIAVGIDNFVSRGF